MVAVTMMPAEFTIDDLDHFPDDGRRYELIEGTLHVTAAPSLPHQRAASNLGALLLHECPEELEVFTSSPAVVLGPRTQVEPDLCVVRIRDTSDRKVEVAPLLVVEVLSPSTRLYDLGTKRLAYRESGVEAFWVVDPTAPSLTVHQWDGGAEVERTFTGVDLAELDHPYRVNVVPARLIEPRGWAAVPPPAST